MAEAGSGADAPRGGAGPAGTIGDAPSFRIPGQHFAASLLFLVAGAAGLALGAPALAAGAFSEPGVVGAVHLLTLGWIGTSIMGALYQLLPVALGAPLRWERVADAAFWCWTVGVAAFAGGVAARLPGLHVPGAVLVGLGALLFAANVAGTLPRTARRDMTWWCVAGSVLFLLGAWVLGLLLAVNLGTGLLGTSRWTVLAVHLHLAAGGWILLTIVGVADRLLPMFLGSRGASRLPGRIAAVLVAGAAAALLLSEHLLPATVVRPALGGMALGAAAFVLQAGLHYRAGRRPALHPGMRLAAAALVFLGLAALAGTAALARRSPDPALLTTYGLLLVPGGLSLFVAGFQLRIVPFMTWSHRFAPRAGREEVPRVDDLVDDRGSLAAAGLLVVGAGLMAAGALAGSTAAARAGGIAFTAGAAVEAVQLLAVLAGRAGRAG